MKPYYEWFEDCAEYQLPDGTPIRARLFSQDNAFAAPGFQPAFDERVYWELSIADSCDEGWVVSWRVAADGALIECHDFLVQDELKGFLRPTTHHEHVSDMTIDDVRPAHE